jgi:hypothetical protein
LGDLGGFGRRFKGARLCAFHGAHRRHKAETKLA